MLRVNINLTIVSMVNYTQDENDTDNINECNRVKRLDHITFIFNYLLYMLSVKVFQMVTKVPILKEVNFGKMQLCRVEHFYNIFVLTFGRDC